MHGYQGLGEASADASVFVDEMSQDAHGLGSGPSFIGINLVGAWVVVVVVVMVVVVGGGVRVGAGGGGGGCGDGSGGGSVVVAVL